MYEARAMRRTNIEQDGAVVPLIDDMVLEDLVVERLGPGEKARHDGQWIEMR
jgi:hypothetical protein